MKTIIKFNSKQKLVSLSDGSQWFINGIPNEIKSKIDKREHPGFGLRQFYGRSIVDFLMINNYSIYNHDKIDHNDAEDHPGDTITDDIRGLTQPSESTVRRALIWQLHYPGEKAYYGIKSGGESNSDHLYESDYCPTIIGANGEDKRILLTKRFSKEFRRVLVTESLLRELYEGSMCKKQMELKKKSDAMSAVDVSVGTLHSIRVRGKTMIKGAEKWTAEQVFDNVFEGLEDNKYVVEIIKARVHQISKSLDHMFGKEREMKIIHMPRTGEDINDPEVKKRLMQSAIEEYNRKLLGQKDYNWILTRFQKKASKVTNTGVQIDMFVV